MQIGCSFLLARSMSSSGRNGFEAPCRTLEAFGPAIDSADPFVPELAPKSLEEIAASLVRDEPCTPSYW